jgi:hypothetical protein
MATPYRNLDNLRIPFQPPNKYPLFECSDSSFIAKVSYAGWSAFCTALIFNRVLVENESRFLLRHHREPWKGIPLLYTENGIPSIVLFTAP